MSKSGVSIVAEETLGSTIRRELDRLLARSSSYLARSSSYKAKMPKSGFGIVVEETLARLDSLITDETVIGSNLRRELDRLLVLRVETRIVLQTAEEKHNIAGDLRGYHMVSYWLNNLKEAAFMAEDLIDELAFQILHPKVKVTNLWFNNLLFNVKLSHRVRVLNQSFDKIKYEIRNISLDRRIPSRAMDGVTDHSVLFDNQIIGREADVSKIVNLLTRSSDRQVLTVVPIVGLPGLGKTALAKFVCRQVMALKLFNVKIWVCVSEKCDEQEILGQISRYLKKDAVFEQLGKELERKRFLLVLDDVWGDVSSWWDDFRTRLLKICKHIEIAVLVTTRCEQVASVVETSSRHRHTLDFLSDEECWFILKERAFRNVTLQQSNLEAIGREIAKKCRGVPLAAKALGGTLGFNCWDEGTRDINYRIERAWVQIRDSYFFKEIVNDESNVKLILQLCFRDLPLPLKKCFALCSVFPKGFLFIKEDLIYLWMAERLADSYDIGNEYFHALLTNSFFQDAECDDDGNVVKCKMLNSGPDLVLYIEKFEFEIPRKYLYVDYQSITTSEALPENMAEYLSTIILNGAPFQSFWNLKRLRMLYLNDVDMKILPSSISKSKHLKYLHVSYTKTSPLPKPISELYMLQILTLSNCSCEHLPFLGGLPYLKFLKISMDRVKFIGNESYEGNSSEQHDQLMFFPALKSLSLSWMENLVAWTPPSHGNTVVIFPRLENLSIKCCAKLTGFPMRDLSTLVKGEFKDCEELRFIFGEHKSFPLVTSLSIAGCPKLTYLRNWLLSNKSYKEFRVRRCEWLKFIPADLGMQRFLVSLQIYCCKRLGFFSEEILCKLTQLRKLSIGAFSEKLDDFHYLNQIEDLTYLEELEIWGSDVFGRKMSVLPIQLQHLASLQSLKIKGFTTMKALPEWLGALQTLETISLNYCWHLEHQSTAAIIQRLSNLSHVYIHGCPALEEHKSQWKEFTVLDAAVNPTLVNYIEGVVRVQTSGITRGLAILYNKKKRFGEVTEWSDKPSVKVLVTYCFCFCNC